MQVCREIETNEWNDSQRKVCGTNEPLSFPLRPIVMEDYKEYRIEEILNSKFIRRKRIFPSQMERVIR